MDIAIHMTLLPHTSLGVDVRNEVECGGMSWLVGT